MVGVSFLFGSGATKTHSRANGLLRKMGAVERLIAAH